MVAVAALAWVTASCVSEAPIQGASCNLEHPCPSPYACLGGECGRLSAQVVLGCISDQSCSSGSCLESVGFCVQCDEDADCLGSTCLGGVFVCGCLQGSDCLTGRCLVDTGTCASCFSDAQCDSGICDVATGRCGIPQRTEDESVREDIEDPP